VRRLVLISFAVLAAALITWACGDSEDAEEDPIPCADALTEWYEVCGFTVSLDKVNETSYEDALDSCQEGGGHMWHDFTYCYEHVYPESDYDCAAFAECAPKHAFDQDDDTDDDLTDDDTADDDTVDDDTTDDDTTDDDTADDDTADDDTTDDDTV